MSKTANQILGRLGERLGFVLLERNYRTSIGEVDLVVCDEDATIFAEVKTRRAGGLDPLLAITALKRRRMRAVAAAWLADRPVRPRSATLRIDVVAIVVDDRGALVSLEQFEDVA
jgi:putative endonuclease